MKNICCAVLLPATTPLKMPIVKIICCVLLPASSCHCEDMLCVTTSSIVKIRIRRIVESRGLVVELGTAEPAAGVRFPACALLARIQNRYGDSTGQFGSCPISIWRSGVLGHSSPGT